MLQFQNLEAQVETSVTGILKVLRSLVVATMLAPFQVLKDCHGLGIVDNNELIFLSKLL